MSKRTCFPLFSRAEEAAPSQVEQSRKVSVLIQRHFSPWHLITYTKVISQKKAIKTLIETFQKNAVSPDKMPLVGIGSADDPDSVQFMKRLIEDLGYKTVEFEVGPVIGTHVGKGMIVIIYLGSNREDILK